MLDKYIIRVIVFTIAIGTSYAQQADSTDYSDQINEKFFLSSNGVTIICAGAEFGESGTVNDITYTKRDKQDISIQNAATTCTSGVTDLSYLFYSLEAFNEDISHWVISGVYDMSYMFYDAKSFSQDLSNWCVSNLPSEPVNFSEGSALKDNQIPKWGKCELR
jgi:hypothetical protein